MWLSLFSQFPVDWYSHKYRPVNSAVVGNSLFLPLQLYVCNLHLYWQMLWVHFCVCDDFFFYFFTLWQFHTWVQCILLIVTSHSLSLPSPEKSPIPCPSLLVITHWVLGVQPAGMLTGLIDFICAGDHSCTTMASVTAMSCPDDGHSPLPPFHLLLQDVPVAWWGLVQMSRVGLSTQ